MRNSHQKLPHKPDGYVALLRAEYLQFILEMSQISKHFSYSDNVTR